MLLSHCIECGQEKIIGSVEILNATCLHRHSNRFSSYQPFVIGNHWTAVALLMKLPIQIGEILAHQTFDIECPLGGELAMWTDRHHSLLPANSHELNPPEAF